MRCIAHSRTVQLRFLGQQGGVSGAHPEARRQRVRGTHAHPAHVFGAKLLPPGRRAAEVLVVILRRNGCDVKSSDLIWQTDEPDSTHLFQSPLCSRGYQVTVLVLQ